MMIAVALVSQRFGRSSCAHREADARASLSAAHLGINPALADLLRGRQIQPINRTGDTTMFTNMKIALVAALVIGTASAALAGAKDEDERGGFVVPGSMDGVNPAYHPDIFGNPATARAYGFVQSRDHTWHVQGNWRQWPHSR
jgi:hypothetical protein